VANGKISATVSQQVTTYQQAVEVSDTMTQITPYITVPRSGLYFVIFAISGADMTKRRAIQVWDNRDSSTDGSHIIIGGYSGYKNYCIKVLNLTAGTQLRGMVRELDSANQYYAAPNYNYLQIVSLT